MKSKSNGAAPERPENAGLPPITELSIEGFKSFGKKQAIAIRPLTVLAGANSSGKSSAMQPLLLLKQTLESRFDAGPLKIDGPNVQFAASEQFLSKSGNLSKQAFTIGITAGGRLVESKMRRAESGEMKVVESTYCVRGGSPLRLRSDMTHAEVERAVEGVHPGSVSLIKQVRIEPQTIASGVKIRWLIHSDGFLLTPGIVAESSRGENFTISFEASAISVNTGKARVAGTRTGRFLGLNIDPDPSDLETIAALLHVPGWRGIPARSYPVASVSSRFPGLFIDYFASVILHWQDSKDARLLQLSQLLARLSLSSWIFARRIGDIGIELQVSRLPVKKRSTADDGDRVNLADVGTGVQYILPALVALVLAQTGQTVYVEQPEIHLHPRAQVELGAILIEAANRGVRVVVETHSDLLLRVFQTSVARGDIGTDDVALHWFSRNPKTGDTKVTTAELTDNGSFGEWPEDFGDVYLQAEGAFLDAAQSRNLANSES